MNVTTPARAGIPGPRRRMPAVFGELVTLPAVVLVVVVFAALGAPQFTLTNLQNVLVQNSTVAILALGLTVVILAGGLDLSVGATAATCGVVAVAVMRATGSGALGFAAALAAGLVVGAIVGGFITGLNLVPFVATLAALYMVNGVTLVLTEGRTIAPVPTEVLLAALGTVAGVPVPIAVLVVLYVLGHLALSRTSWGRQVTLVGANRRTAQISGVADRWISFTTYVVAGGCAALAGAMLAARTGGAAASTGTGVLFTAIGAVVIGGTSLFGGRGSLIRTAVGVLFLGFLTNGMQILGLASFDQAIATGIVILLAVALDTLVLSRNRRDA